MILEYHGVKYYGIMEGLLPKFVSRWFMTSMLTDNRTTTTENNNVIVCPGGFSAKIRLSINQSLAVQNKSMTG